MTNPFDINGSSVARSRLVAVTEFKLNFVADFRTGKSLKVARVNDYIILLSLNLDEAKSSIIKPTGYFTFQYILPLNYPFIQKTYESPTKKHEVFVKTNL